MTPADASLIAAAIPRPVVYGWAAVVLAFCVVHEIRTRRRFRRFVAQTEAKLRDLERRTDESEARVEAEIARMRAEVDAYGAWSDANDRFFHHGLVAVSHLLGARALPERRACATVRSATKQRRSSEAPTWRPVAGHEEGSSPPSGSSPPPWPRRRSCH